MAKDERKSHPKTAMAAINGKNHSCCYLLLLKPSLSRDSLTYARAMQLHLKSLRTISITDKAGIDLDIDGNIDWNIDAVH